MKGLAVLIVLSLALLCVANSAYSTVEWEPYTIVDGLAGGNIRAIAEDKSGYLWIATDGDGVSRYDGERFLNFSTEDGLPSNYVWAFLRDSRGDLWFATGLGACKYDDNGFGTILNIEDGLVNNFITSIAEDKKGNLWFGTKGGVSKYDGTKFTNFTTDSGLVDDYIRAILEDDAGNLWFGTGGGGLSKYDGEKFTNFTMDDGLAHNFVGMALKDTAGNLWFGTNNGISKYDGTKFENFTTENGLGNNSIRSLLEDSKGCLWVGTAGGVARYNGRDFQNFTSKHGLVGDNVTAICESSDGNLWFGTWGHGVSRRDNRIQHYLEDKDIEYAIEDRDGNLWFGAKGGEVFRYDGKAFQDFTSEVGLTIEESPTILEGKNGDIWFTGSGVITRYNDKKFQSIKDIGLEDMLIEPVFVDSRDRIWFSMWEKETPVKIGKYDGKGFQYFPVEGRVFPSGPGDEKVLEDKKGNIWFVTGQNRIYKYDGTGLVCFTTDDGLAGGRVSSVAEDKAGNLWFGIRLNDVPDARGAGGLSMYTGEFSAELKYQTDLDSGNIPGGLKEAFNNNGFILSHAAGVIVKSAGQRWLIRDLLFSVTASFSSNPDIENIPEDLRQAFLDNRLILSQNILVTPGEEIPNCWLIVDRDNKQTYAAWINRDKISIYDNRKTYVIRKDNGKLNIARFLTYSTQSGLCRDSVTGILEDDDGNLWFRTYHGGVSRYDGNSFENFTTKDGLTSNTIRSMVKDGGGKLWFGSQGAGVNLYDGKNFQTMTKADGLINNTAFVALADSRGNIWFRYDVPGLTRYTPCRDVLPRVVVTQYVTDRPYPADGDVKVAPNTRVVFRYRGLSLNQFGKILYNCKLEGQGEIRENITHEREIEYENLEPGKYKFQVKAVDRDLNYSEPQSLAMTVELPLYERSIFVISSLALFILLCFLIIKLYLIRKTAAQLKEELRQNEEREEQRIREELQKAREMQTNLMSGPIPKFAGFQVYGRCRPVDEVGGDFFRFITSRKEKDKFAIALIDVCGRGMKAAWIALMADGMLHFLARLWQLSAGKLLHELNNGLCERITDKFMFVAFCFALVDMKERTLQFSNAGQMLPIIKRGDDLITITEASGLLLGIIPWEEYHERNIDLKEGDIILFYTDGIIEAANQEGEMYLIDRLEAAFRKADPGLSASQMVDEIFRDVDAFAGEEAQYDDMTVVVLKVSEGGGGDING